MSSTPAVVAAQSSPYHRIRFADQSSSTKLTNDSEPFLTFNAPHPKQGPPSSPAGVEECSARVLGRWKGDAWRVPLFQCQDANMVRTPTSVRRPFSIEQLRMLGFNSDRLDVKPKLTEDHRGQLVSISWPVVLMARLLVGLTEAQATNRDLTSDLRALGGLEGRRRSANPATEDLLELAVRTRSGRSHQLRVVPRKGAP